jgi:hypothetical protein
MTCLAKEYLITNQEELSETCRAVATVLAPGSSSRFDARGWKSNPDSRFWTADPSTTR